MARPDIRMKLFDGNMVVRPDIRMKLFDRYLVIRPDIRVVVDGVDDDIHTEVLGDLQPLDRERLCEVASHGGDGGVHSHHLPQKHGHVSKAAEIFPTSTPVCYSVRIGSRIPSIVKLWCTNSVFDSSQLEILIS